MPLNSVAVLNPDADLTNHIEVSCEKLVSTGARIIFFIFYIITFNY